MSHKPTTDARSKSRGKPLPADLLNGLRALVEKHGETPAREQTGLSWAAFNRALGGLNVFQSTADAVRRALASGPEGANVTSPEGSGVTS